MFVASFQIRLKSDEDDLDWEVEGPDVKEQNDDKTSEYHRAEIVEEIPIEVSSQKPDESAPQVGELLQALTGDEEGADKDEIIETTDGDVNDNLQTQAPVQSSDEGLASGSDDFAPEANDVAETRGDERSPQNEDTEIPLTKEAESDLEVEKTKNIFDSLNLDQEEKLDRTKESTSESASESDSEVLVDIKDYLSEEDKSNTDVMENRMYSSPEPEMPFSQSKVQSVESSNINGLLESLKDMPEPKTAKKSATPPPKSPRKVTDEEVADALRFLLGKGARVPRTRSAMNLRDDSAKKLRNSGGASTTFVLVMMPDGTVERRPSVLERSPSLGNDLDCPDDQMHKLERALRDITPGRKIPKNEFDGREERPPTPRESFSSSASSQSPSDIAESAADTKINQKSSESPSTDDTHSEPDRKTNSKDDPGSVDDKPQIGDSNDMVVPTSHRPDENNFDLSTLERLRPKGEPAAEPVSKPPEEIPSNFSVDDLVNLLPSFDVTESEDDDNDLKDKQTPVVEIEIEVSAPIVPEESSVDLTILEKKQPESAAPIDTRPQSVSDASSRSETRPKSSSDASSRSETRPKSSSDASSRSETRPKSSSDASSRSETRPKSSSDASSRSESRLKSSSDASSRSESRPKSSSDASSRSTEWQEATLDFEDTEDEIVPETKLLTETSPDLKTLEKLRPAGMETPYPVNTEVGPTSQSDTFPVERSGVTVADLEHMLPEFDSCSESKDENKEYDRFATQVREEPLNPITVSPEKNQIDLTGLKEVDSDTEHNGNDSRPYDVSDILDDLSSEEEDWPAPPETSVEMNWQAPPDSLHDAGVQMIDNKHRQEEDDLPPPPPESPPSSRSSVSSPENRIPGFISIETPKRPTSRGSSSKLSPNSTSSIDDDSNQKEITEPPAIIITTSPPDFKVDTYGDVFKNQGQNFAEQSSSSDSEEEGNFGVLVEPRESSVDPQSFDVVKDSSSDEGSSVDAITASPKGGVSNWQETTMESEPENEIKPISLTPSETAPDLSSLERFRPPGMEEPSVAEINDQLGAEKYPSGRGEVSVSELEDILPTFESSSENEDDEPSNQVPIEEESCESSEVTPADNDTPVDLSKLDQMQPGSARDYEPIPRKESELSTESQEITMDFGESEDEEIVVPISNVPVESTPDLVALERKLRPSGTRTPEAVSDTEFQPDNQTTERTGATVEDLKDLIPTLDTTSESSESESSEPTTPVDEMIEEIGSVSPTRTHFNFEGLESFAPKEKAEPSDKEAPLAGFAQRKSQDIIVESYLSLFKEDRTMELLKTFSSNAPVTNGFDGSISEEEPLPVIDFKERTSSSSSAEGGSSSGSEIEPDVIRNSKLPAVELHAPDSPAKKRRSVGHELGEVSDDESPAKKPKTFESLEEEQSESSEPIIIEASISVFREESISDSSPPASPPKPEASTCEEDEEEEWPAPPPPEMLIKEDWPAPPEDLRESEPGNDESGKEDVEDTSSVSTSSTEGEYITEPSPSPAGTDRVFVLTVMPRLETFNEEDEQEEEENENIKRKAEEKPEVDVAVSNETKPDQFESKSSSSSQSDTESSTAGDEISQVIGKNDEDDTSPRLDPQSRDEDHEEIIPDKHGDIQPEELEQNISISTAEPVESAPRETTEIQPGYGQPYSTLEPETTHFDDIPSKVDDLETEVLGPKTQSKPVSGEDKRKKSSSSDTSSSEDTINTHPRGKLHDHDDHDKSNTMARDTEVPKEMKDTSSDENLEHEIDHEENDKNEHEENFEFSPPSHDSETDSASTESSEGNEQVPFSPLGSRVFILTGLPSYPVRNDLEDVDQDTPSKTSEETEDVDPSELKKSQQGEPVPDLIPVKTPPTEETPDFANEKTVEVEPIENLESMPVIAHRLSSDSEDDASSPVDVVVAADVHAHNVPNSPEISPRVALDTFSSPTTDTPSQVKPATSESPSDIGVSEEPVSFEDPHDTIHEHGPVTHSDHGEDIGLDWREPEQSTVDENTYSEPQTHSDMPPSPPPETHEWSSPTDTHEHEPVTRSDHEEDTMLDWHKPEQSTVGESTYSEPQTNSDISPSPPPETHEWSSPPNNNWPSPPRNLGSEISVPELQDSARQPMEQSGRGPSLSHYIPTGKSANVSQPSVPNLAPQFLQPSINSKNMTDDALLDSDNEIAQFTSNRPKETDINEPAVPNLAPYMPTFINTDITDPETFDPLPDPTANRSTDIADPATPPTFDSGVLPSKVTDINDPGTLPYTQESKSTDITDPAVPVFTPDNRQQRSPFQPIDMEASPMTYGKVRPKTPVETETSLVPPDVYTSDDAYEQFQMRYRGNLEDNYDTIPDMRPTHEEPAKSKRKHHEEKARKKAQAVSDIPSYMAPPAPVQNKVAKAKGKKVPPPIPPRIESDPLLRESTPLESRSKDIIDPALHPYLGDQPKRYRPDEPGVVMRHDRPRSRDMDDPPMPYQSQSRSTDIDDPGLPYNGRPKSMNVSDLPMSYPSRARSTDITDPGTSYPMRSRSTDFLPEPATFNHGRPTHAQSMDISSASMPYHVQPRSRSTDFTEPALSYPSGSRSTDITDPGLYFPPKSKSTDITDPGFEPPVPRPTKAAPEYLVPNRGPIPDITKRAPVLHKDVELESLKRQLHRLGTKMTSTRQELDRLKRNNPANKYATPQDRAAHSRGSSRSSIDSPDAELTDLKFSRKFFASLTDKEFGKMLEEMRRYRLNVRDKGADLKRLAKQCDGIRLRLKQLGDPVDFPAATTKVRVGAIETTI